MSTRRVEIGPAFSYGWRTLMDDITPWVLLALLGILAGSVLGWLGEVAAGTPLGFVSALAMFVVTNAIGFLMVSMALAAVQGREVAIPNVWARPALLMTYLATTFLFFLIVAFGLVLLIVPGLVWLVTYYFYGYVVIDEDADPLVALQRSRELTRGRRLRLFRAGLTALLVNLLGLMAFGVGVLLTYPITIIAGAHIYRQLQGERVGRAVAVTRQPAL